MLNGIINESGNYNYLLGMNLWSLTYEKVEELKKQEEEKQTQLEILKNKAEDIWKDELEELLNKYEEWYELKNEINNEQVVVKTQKKKSYERRKSNLNI